MGSPVAPIALNEVAGGAALTTDEDGLVTLVVTTDECHLQLRVPLSGFAGDLQGWADEFDSLAAQLRIYASQRPDGDE